MYDIIYMNINIYMQIHVNIFQIYAVCVRLYIHKYTQHTHIYYVNKPLFWMRLKSTNIISWQR